MLDEGVVERMPQRPLDHGPDEVDGRGPGAQRRRLVGRMAVDGDGPVGLDVALHGDEARHLPGQVVHGLPVDLGADALEGVGRQVQVVDDARVALADGVTGSEGAVGGLCAATLLGGFRFRRPRRGGRRAERRGRAVGGVLARGGGGGIWGSGAPHAGVVFPGRHGRGIAGDPRRTVEDRPPTSLAGLRTGGLGQRRGGLVILDVHPDGRQGPRVGTAGVHVLLEMALAVGLVAQLGHGEGAAVADGVDVDEGEVEAKEAPFVLAGPTSAGERRPNSGT
ncbi:hypothetical protein VTN02DRAFT_1432 [Thermoascus thermophilus]